MDYSWTPGAALPFISALCLAVAANAALRGKQVAASRPFIAIQVCAFIWSFFYGIELCAHRLEDALFWSNLATVGMVLLPSASALFALVYSNKMRRPTNLGWLLLLFQPITVLPLVWMNPGDVFRRGIHLEKVGTHHLLAFEPGPAYIYNLFLSLALMVYVCGTLFYLAAQRRNAFRKQARMLLAAFTFPMVADLVYQIAFEPVKNYDAVPAMFCVCAAMVTYSLFRLSFLDLAPIARGTTVEQMVDPVVVMNARGKLVDCNRAASKIFELSPDALLGKDAHKLLQAAGRFTDSNVGNGALYHHRGRVFALKRSPLNDPYRGEIGQVLHFSDLTERLELERHLKEAKEEADSASLAKSNFLANMSHEIRTPMNGVIGLGDLLVATRLDTRQIQYVQAIQSCSRSLMHIIDEILDFSKIEAGKMVLNPEPLDLVSLVRDVTIAHRVIAEGKGLRFYVELPAGRRLPVNADPSAVRQVLNNLIGNATKFTASGSVSVRLDELSGDRYSIEVEDTGIGIPMSKQQQVFDRFSQADESTTREFGGTGLGLTITRQLVRMLGGEISVQSQEGVGSLFRVELHLPKALMPEVQGPANEPLHLRVLLAEDNLVNTMVIESQLDQLGCSITHCADGRATVEAYKAGVYDVVLLDVQMPVMGGIEACRMIRSFDDGRTPVVALTANALEEEKQRCMQVGMNAFLTKPTTLRQLRETLYKVTRASA